MAGWKFQRRNPSRAPARAKHRTAISGCPVVTWVVRLMMPSVTAAMNATPDDRPSSPSIQLMLLIIPTIQKTVSPAATTPVPANEIGRPPNGLATKSIVMPSATAPQARRIWPRSW